MAAARYDFLRRVSRGATLLGFLTLGGAAGCNKERSAALPAQAPAERPSRADPGRATALVRSALSPAEVEGKEARLKRAAESLALYCQSLPATWRGGEYGDAWVPAEARELGGTVSFATDSVQVYKGDREHTHGYILKRVAPDGPLGSRWELAQLQEDGTRPLFTVTLPSGARLDVEEIVRRARPEYDRRVEQDPRELRWHRSRALFLLTFPFPHHRSGDPPPFVRALAAHRRQLSGRYAAARLALLDSADRLPDHFWPPFMLALLETATGIDRAATARLLEVWTEQHKSFSSLSHLAQLYRLTGRLAEACAAEQRAFTLPMREEPGDELNGSALGYEIAAAAYQGQLYPCAEQIARALREKEPDRYTRQRYELPLRALQAAALFAQGRHAEARALVASDGLREKDPFYRDQSAELPGLAQALQQGDLPTLRNWQPAHTGLFDDTVFNSLDLPGLLGLRR